MRQMLVMMVLGVALPAAAEVYRWTDANGQVHYGERPPVQGAQKLELPSAGRSPGDLDQDAADRRERQRRLLDAFAYERERRAADAARQTQEQQRADQRCQEFKLRWRRLNHPGPVYYRREGGERDYLSDEQRKAELARMLPAYRQACGTEP